MKLSRLLAAPTILGLVAAGCVATATASDAATGNYTLITAPVLTSTHTTLANDFSGATPWS